MNISKLSVGLVALLLAGGSAAHAEDPRFGLQATLSMPQGDLGSNDWLDGEKGIGIGAHVQMNIKKGLKLIPRLDFAAYERDLSGTYQGYHADVNLKVSVLTIGADLNYYLDGPDLKNLYLIGGLGYASAKFEETLNVSDYYGDLGSGNYSETKNSIYLAVGFGYDFTQHISAEIRYQALNKYSLPGQDVSGPSLNASFIYRF